MINIKNIVCSLDVDINLPLSYEYDTQTQSIVVLDGYIYIVYYNNDSKEYKEIVDLRHINNESPI